MKKLYIINQFFIVCLILLTSKNLEIFSYVLSLLFIGANLFIFFSGEKQELEIKSEIPERPLESETIPILDPTANKLFDDLLQKAVELGYNPQLESAMDDNNVMHFYLLHLEESGNMKTLFEINPIDTNIENNKDSYNTILEQYYELFDGLKEKQNDKV